MLQTDSQYTTIRRTNFIRHAKQQKRSKCLAFFFCIARNDNPNLNACRTIVLNLMQFK